MKATCPESLPGSLEILVWTLISPIWSWTDVICKLVFDLILNWYKMHVSLRSDLELMQDERRSQIWSLTDARCRSNSDLILNWCKMHVGLHIMGGVIMLVSWWMFDWILSWFVYFQVSRPPLFFKETNPQPRKHTLWQATSDFTGGQATTCKWVIFWGLLINEILVVGILVLNQLSSRFHNIVIFSYSTPCAGTFNHWPS
jgi:hypothetical protein